MFETCKSGSQNVVRSVARHRHEHNYIVKRVESARKSYSILTPSQKKKRWRHSRSRNLHHLHQPIHRHPRRLSARRNNPTLPLPFPRQQSHSKDFPHQFLPHRQTRTIRICKMSRRTRLRVSSHSRLSRNSAILCLSLWTSPGDHSPFSISLLQDAFSGRCRAIFQRNDVVRSYTERSTTLQPWGLSTDLEIFGEESEAVAWWVYITWKAYGESLQWLQ